MMNFLNDTANLGTTARLEKAAKRKHQGQTVTDMRQDLITRATDTIKALEEYKGGSFRAPMARSIHNGICVKIGYGKRNVGFFEGEGETRVAIIPDRNFHRSERFAAKAYLHKMIEAVNAGEFDELLTQTLNKLKARFVKDDDKSNEKSSDNVHAFAAE